MDVPEYGVRGKRGDFEPLISEELFYRVQSVLSGRVPTTTPQQRAHPDFPLRAFVRCESCGRGLTGSWSKGRSEYYAYYHCRPGCRAVNVTKAKLEGLFADELALLQPSPGYMRVERPADSTTAEIITTIVLRQNFARPFRSAQPLSRDQHRQPVVLQCASMFLR